MKGGVAAILAAVRALVVSGAAERLAGELIVALVPGEEDGGQGTLAAIRAYAQHDVSAFLTCRPGPVPPTTPPARPLRPGRTVRKADPRVSCPPRPRRALTSRASPNRQGSPPPMTDQATAARPARPASRPAARPRPKRGEGQWALGYTRAAERQRAVQEGRRPAQRPRPGSCTSTPSAASPRSTRPTCAAGSAGWGSTPSARPASTAARPRSLEPEELDDEYFMLRVRSDGGLLTTDAAAGARRASRPTSPATPPTSPTGRTSSTTGSGSRTCPRSGSGSTRSASTRIEACGDSPRPFLGSPVAGVAADEIIDGTPALEEIKRRYIGNPAYSNLPRKFKTAAHRAPQPRRRPRGQRRLLRRHRPPRARPRLRPLGRRRPVDQPDARPEARRLDPARRGRRRLGGRHLDLPRLRLPPAALAGPAEVPGRRLGRREVPRGARERVPRPRARRLRVARPGPRSRRPHRRAPSRRTAGSTSASPRPSAGSPAPMLVRLADLVEQYGVARRPRSRRTRSSCVLGVDAGPGRRPRRRRSTGSGSRPGPSNWRRNTMACTGIEFCKLAIVETKQRAARPGRRARAALPRPRRPDHGQRQRLPERLRPHPGRRHRPQGPAGPGRRRQPGRGLPGAPRRRARPASRSFGKKLRAHKVTSAGLDDYVTNVVTRVPGPARRAASRFAAWVARADEDAPARRGRHRELEAVR